MTQLATSDSVIGSFDNVVLEHNGSSFLLTRNGDEFWAEMDFPEWDAAVGPPPRVQCQITMLTGSHHMQVCWFPSGQSRMLGILPFVYLTEAKRWIPRNAAFLRPPGLAEPIFGVWNESCLQCHATHPQPRLGDRSALEMDSMVAEFGIACEACHGPGESHIRANQSPGRRYGMHLSDKVDDTIVNPQRLDHRRSSQVCGQCHSAHTFLRREDWEAWKREGSAFRPGDDLHSARNVLSKGSFDSYATQQTLKQRPGLFEQQFWPDGMIRVAGREYSGLVETACFQRGEMSCLTCHSMHRESGDERSNQQWAEDQLRPIALTNAVCTDCHSQYAERRELAAHTRHSPDSAGSNCYNCHMPYATYGLLKAIRNHEIDSPSVATTINAGRLNACNQCHLEKTLAWTDDWLQQWYQHDPASLEEEHQRVAASVAMALKGDAAQRALMAWSLAWPDAVQTSGDDWQVPILAQLLTDPYDAVRYIASRSLRHFSGFEELEYDFLAAESDRQAAREQVIERWEDRFSGGVESPETVLIHPDGGHDRAEAEAMNRLRDDRPVLLAE